MSLAGSRARRKSERRITTRRSRSRFTSASAIKLRWRRSSANSRRPGSPKYGQFLTPEEFHAQFAPEAADVALVRDTLHGLGLTPGYTPASGLFVTATGTVAQIKAAFHVTQNLYLYKGKTLRANAEAPLIPVRASQTVMAISGLDEARLLTGPPHRLANVSPAALPGPPPDPKPEHCSTYWSGNLSYVSPAPRPYPDILPWFICGYTPAQIREAYGVNKVSRTGRGVRVAIVGTYASPTIVEDVNRFSKNHGLPPLNYLNFSQIVPPGIYKVPADDPCGPQAWYVEETLDVEAVHGISPDAFLLYAGAGCTTGADVDETLYNLIDNRLADIVANGWLIYGGEEAAPPSRIESDTAQFLQAAAEGMTLLFPSGDEGDGTVLGDVLSGGNWPNGSPYVTVVGGTSLALLNSSGEKSEWGWSSYINYLNNPEILDTGHLIMHSGLVRADFRFLNGSGGGPSLVELQPSYQKGIVPASMSEVAYTLGGIRVPLEPARRVTPDISMVADPYTGVLIGETFAITNTARYDAGCLRLSSTTQYCERAAGGTSASSPLFAGVLALVDEERLSNFLRPIGFVNPALYRLNTDVEGRTAPIIDVHAPTSPLAVLSSFFDVPGFIPITTINSVPNSTNTAAIEGLDTSLRAGPKYDNVTGLGVPNLPCFLQALGSR